MKKIIITSIVLLALPALVLAAFQPATLYKGADRVAVYTQEMAQKYFGMGYALETKAPVSAPVKVEKVCDCEETLGAFAGPDIYNRVTVHDKFIDGGRATNASSSLYSNFTLTAKQVCDNNIIYVNGTTGQLNAVTMTLPATSTLFSTCLKEVGAHTSFIFANLSATAATTTTIAAGSGMDLLECDDSSDCNVVIGGLGYAKIDIFRMPPSFGAGLDAAVTVTEYTAAD